MQIDFLVLVATLAFGRTPIEPSGAEQIVKQYILLHPEALTAHGPGEAGSVAPLEAYEDFCKFLTRLRNDGISEALDDAAFERILAQTKSSSALESTSVTA